MDLDANNIEFFIVFYKFFWGAINLQIQCSLIQR